MVFRIHITTSLFEGDIDFNSLEELRAHPNFQDWWFFGTRLAGTNLSGHPDFSQFRDSGQTLGQWLHEQKVPEGAVRLTPLVPTGRLRHQIRRQHVRRGK